MIEKEKFVRDFNEAFAKNDVEFIISNMSEDVEWELVGDQTTKGKEDVKELMGKMKDFETLEMEILRIITHGKLAAANGTMKIKEPSGKIKSFGFSDFYEFDGFKSPKIKKMTSYVVKLEEGQDK